MSAVPDRVRWAVELLDPRPDDVVLEVGCGPGVAAELVCARLTTGRMVAVDRSAVAVERTTRRNAEHVAAGRLTVVEAALDGLDLPEHGVDRAFSVNVNLFWTGDPAAELAVLRRALRPGGLLLVLYGTGPGGPDKATAAVAGALAAHGFTGVERVGSAAGSGVRALRGSQPPRTSPPAPGA
ncbi:class I SAM-dependent methyltransferase [Geodermatophilus sp. SYSU D00691]